MLDDGNDNKEIENMGFDEFGDQKQPLKKQKKLKYENQRVARSLK